MTTLNCFFPQKKNNLQFLTVSVLRISRRLTGVAVLVFVIPLSHPSTKALLEVQQA